jgi:hypothetical protein
MEAIMNKTMNRMAQQEQRALRRQKGSANPCGINRMCLLSLMLAPLTIIIVIVYFLQVYNEMDQPEIKMLQTTGISSAQAMKENETAAEVVLVKAMSDNLRAQRQMQEMETLVLTTALGQVKITMRPDLSKGSVDYIHRLIKKGPCQRRDFCNFYRADKPGILQGIMAGAVANGIKGTCPPGFENVTNDCPAKDKQCGCHGPVMTKGAVAWVNGQAGGPDFFIDNYNKPAMFWGTQHTHFGFIADEESFQVISKILNQPTKFAGGMAHILRPVHFKLSLLLDTNNNETQ